MLLRRNPAHHLLKAYKVADHQALAAHHQAASQRQPDYLCGYAAYLAFHATLRRYRPTPRLKALVLAGSLVGLLLTAAYKYYWLFTH